MKLFGMAEQGFSSTFLRGIPNKSPQFFDSNGQVTGGIFQPASEQLPVDNYFDLSINWEDDHIVEKLTLYSLTDEGKLHFTGGVARISLEKIDDMRKEVPYIGVVEYRRSPLPNNKYHGDLMLQKDVFGEKPKRRALRERLRRTIVEVLPPIED